MTEGAATPGWTGRLAKLIVNLQSNVGEVSLEQDGVKTKLRMVTDIHIDEYGVATVAMIVPNTDLKVEVSDLTAAAILRADSRRQLSFLDDKDAFMLGEVRALLSGTLGWPEDDPRLAPIKKIIAELDRRSEVPF